MVADLGGQSVAVVRDYERKLIAVVYADMVAYSRLIGLDDAGTFERLRELRRDLIDPALLRHGGTLVNTAGDSLLVTFDSIIPAMRFAVDVQRGVPDFDGDYAPDRRIRFRMGVNVGDVIPDGTNLHGEGVNIAARLQSVCPPGAICVSRIVRDHIGNRLGFGFRELGAIALKNIAQPTEAFLLELSPVSAAPARTLWPGRRMALGAAALVCLAVAVFGGLEWAGGRLRSGTPPPVEAPQASRPRMSIAILPFASPAGDADLARLADGVTEDLTTDLAQLSGGLVSPRQSALRFKDQPVDAAKAGQDLNVRYLLMGSLRRMGPKVRVNASMISGETSATLWVDQLDVGMPDGANGQEAITDWLRNATKFQLFRVEAARGARERPDHPDVVDLYLQAYAAMQEPPSMQRGTKAEALFEQALRLDPASVPAMTGLAQAILFRNVRLGTNLTGAELDRARMLIEAAEAVAPTQANVLWLRGELLRVQQRWPEAEVAFEHMLTVYPHSDGALGMLAICKIQLGQSEDAIPIFQRLINGDPHAPDIWSRYNRLGQAYLFTERYDDAVRWLQRALAAAPELSVANRSYLHADMASAYALAGNAVSARQEITEASSSWPYLTVRAFWAGTVTNEAFEAQLERVRDGLRLTGLRDHANEDEDFGTPADNSLRSGFAGKTPMTVPGATTIRTPDVEALLHDGKAVVIDADSGNRTLPGAINVRMAGLGGTLQDGVQDRLRPFMAKVTSGDPSRPVVTVGFNAERWAGYNLALRLAALGYRQVYWYRGGREAWEVAGLPIVRVEPTMLATR